MAYLGNAPVVGDSTNSFRLLDDIASFTVTFDATDTSIVSISGDTLSFTNHRFVTGQKVTYTDGGGTAIGGLTDGTSYFIIKVDQNQSNLQLTPQTQHLQLRLILQVVQLVDLIH